MSLNAELYRQLGYVADDKSCMKKILDYVKGIVAKNEEEKAEAAREKAETIESLRRAFAELKAVEEGKVKCKTWEEFRDELQREGYYD